MTITRQQVMPLVLAASPSFLPRWREIEHDDYYLADDGSRSGYSDSYEVALHLGRLQVERQHREVTDVFAVIERLRIEGDDYVRELACVGYLEDVQNVALRDDSLQLEDFEPYLGPQSREDWHRLIAQWSGQPYDRDPGSTSP